MNTSLCKYWERVLITWASSAIWKAMAEQLATEWFNLVLTWRNNDALEKLAKNLMASSWKDVIICAGDLSQSEDVKRLIEVCDTYPVGIAILNAWFGTSWLFKNSDIENELSMIDVNCRAVCELSYYFAHKFTERKSWAIVFLSSIVAYQPSPYIANYAATKAYVDSFSKWLRKELQATWVDVLTVALWPVDTGFERRANMQMWRVLSPSEVASDILDAIWKKWVVHPGWLSKLLWFALLSWPRIIRTFIMWSIMKGFTAHQRD